MLTTTSTSINPYKLGIDYFCQCPECKEHRIISIHTFRKMNSKTNPISKRCRKCFAKSNTIEERKLNCNICNIEYEVNSASMCNARKKNYSYICLNCNKKELPKRGKNFQFKKGHIPKHKNSNPNKKEDNKKRQLNWSRCNKDKIGIQRKLKLYNLTQEEYFSLFMKYNNSCAICKRHQNELPRVLCIDHCHKTGKVRGLLCAECNSGLGMFKDNPLFLEKAIKYINNEWLN